MWVLLEEVDRSRNLMLAVAFPMTQHYSQSTL